MNSPVLLIAIGLLAGFIIGAGVAGLVLRAGQRRDDARLGAAAARQSLEAARQLEAQEASARELRHALETQARQQTELAGRLSQLFESAAQRDAALRQTLAERLDAVTQRVGHTLSESQQRASGDLKQLHERLALIDRAQKNIEQLSGEVSGLQAVLSNKQARGAFGEKQMNDILEGLLSPNQFTLQATLSNNSRVDALIHLPNDQGDVAVDAKFPLEAWRALAEAETEHDRKQACQRLRRDVMAHIKAIAGKYLIIGETHEVALMFLPSEAVYAELHAGFADVVEAGFKAKVMIVSPTTFMATLHTMKAVMRDAAMREQAHVILLETTKMGEDVRRLDERVAKLQRHFGAAEEDVRQIRISTDKITRRSERMEELERPDELPANVTALHP